MVKQPLTRLQESMLGVLRGIAQKGQECPSAHALANQVGCHVNGYDLMRSLARKGYIEVDQIGYKMVVRLTDTGESTAIPDGVTIAGVDVRIGGDPCWYCGARHDAPVEFKCRSCR